MTNDIVDTNKLTADLQAKYPNAGIKSIEVDDTTGKSTFLLEPTKQNLAFLEKPGQAIKPHVYGREYGSTINRDFISRQTLDLGLAKSPYDEDPKTLYKQADQFYYTDPLLGSVINMLASLSMKGFENDIDDENIKQFFDTWAFDVNFDELLEWIFLDFFKIGHVTTYKVLSKYEPRVSHLSPVPGQKNKKQGTASELNRLQKLHGQFEKEKSALVKQLVAEAKLQGFGVKEVAKLEQAAKKNIWSKGHLPVSYTVVNPQLVTIEGNLLFDNVAVKLTPPQELGQMLKKDKSALTEEEKELIKSLPNELKTAAEKGGEFQLDSRLVGMVTYRKQPYERYAKPRSTRVFETINYKQKLKDADLSTLDGITNYILKITIGNDEYPVVNQTELETIAKLFDTPSKSFDVVWNHTLSVEKIISPEIEAILGQDKYKQVNEDMTAGLSVTRAIIDGTGDINTAEVGLLTKGIMEEVNYARRQVEKWIYKEYRQIAEAMGFDRFPKVRWDEGVLKDTILYMNTLAQLVDRRMLSYRTALEALGFDYTNESKNMETEFPLVEEGLFGIIGSPWQKSANQPTQNSPTGTPSAGRPKGTTKTKTTNTDPSKQQNTKPSNKTKTASIEGAAKIQMVKSMDKDQWIAFLSGAKEELNDDDYSVFLDTMSKIRFGG
ncbi:MAG: hypothetical protein KAH05_08920 [Clostridiales bacterium]|nr:hypothetical protein [Clostridiales bacterium]